MSKIVQQLRKARKSRKISQATLGRLLSIPQSHISAIESGVVDPRLSSLTELARVLDLEPMLIPRNLISSVQSLIRGEQEDTPLWQLDENEKETL